MTCAGKGALANEIQHLDADPRKIKKCEIVYVRRNTNSVPRTQCPRNMPQLSGIHQGSAWADPLKPYLHPSWAQSKARVFDSEWLLDIDETVISYHLSHDQLDFNHRE